MKILDSYKKIAQSLMIEADIDDDKVIGTRKNKDGETVKVTVKQAMDYSGDDKDMLNLKQKAKDLKDKGDSDTKTEPSTKVTDFERPGSDDEPEDEPMDTKVDSFEDSKKFVAALEDVESDLSDLGQKFRDDEEFKKSHDSYGDEKDDMDVPLSDRYYNEVEERIDNIRKEISRITYDDPNAVDYEDDTELQDKITQSVKDKVDNLSDDTKEFLNNREEFMKKLYDPNEYDIKESKEPTKPKVHPFEETYKRIGGK